MCRTEEILPYPFFCLGLSHLYSLPICSLLELVPEVIFCTRGYYESQVWPHLSCLDYLLGDLDGDGISGLLVNFILLVISGRTLHDFKLGVY